MKDRLSIIEDIRRPRRRDGSTGNGSGISSTSVRGKRAAKRPGKAGPAWRVRSFLPGKSLWIPALLLAGILLLLLPRLFHGQGTTSGENEYHFVPRESAALPDLTEDNSTENLPFRPIPADEQDPLILVNREHPLPASYIPETAALRYGMASSRLCLDDLQAMMDDCRAAGLRPLICSSYRSYDKQEELYLKKVKFYQDQGILPGKAADLASQVVAPPGESEHQTGLAFDIVDMGYQLLDEKQEKTPVSQWLRENAVRYGFIVRYPPDKTGVTGIIYEPWHYRYVGKENAGEILSSGLTLEEYLSDGPED